MMIMTVPEATFAAVGQPMVTGGLSGDAGSFVWAGIVLFAVIILIYGIKAVAQFIAGLLAVVTAASGKGLMFAVAFAGLFAAALLLNVQA